MKPALVASLAVLLVFLSTANAQTEGATTIGRKNTYSAFVEYANDSSHIVLGRAPNRKFAALGIQYERRLVANRKLTLRYAAEFRPLILERDVTEIETFIETIGGPDTIVNPPVAVTRCTPSTEVFSFTIEISCSHRWSYAQGLSPFGTRMNFRPSHRLQPTASLFAGYLLSSKKIPIDTAGSFNFSFEIGAGIEYFLSPSRSMRFEYQLQHFSNAYTASTNPGVDSGLFKLSYTFGK
jgi:hypothetical protein